MKIPMKNAAEISDGPTRFFSRLLLHRLINNDGDESETFEIMSAALFSSFLCLFAHFSFLLINVPFSN